MVREKITDMPGKLDHASCVAYHVTRRGADKEPSTPPGGDISQHLSASFSEAMDTEPTVALTLRMENSAFTRVQSAQCVEHLVEEPVTPEQVELVLREPPSPMRNKPEQLVLHDLVDKPRKEKNNNDNGVIKGNGIENRPVSPYEQLPVSDWAGNSKISIF